MGIILESSFLDRLEKINSDSSFSELYFLSDTVVYKKYLRKKCDSSNFAHREEKLDLLCKERIDDVVMPADKVFERLEYCDGFYLAGHLMSRVKTSEIGSLKLLLESPFYTLREKALYLLEAEAIIKRCHASPSDIVIGDANSSNFLIDVDKKLKFVDFDGVGIGKFSFEFCSFYTTVAGRILEGIKGQDIDKVALGFMVMEELCFVGDQLGFRNFVYTYSMNAHDIGEHIDLLDVSKQSKEVFRALISDTSDRPYVGEVLKEVSEKEGNFLMKRRVV